MGKLRVAACVAAACCAAAAAADCDMPPAWAFPSAAEAPPRVALLVRGDAFRDCGHGFRCAAAGDEAMLAAAKSQVLRFIEPFENAGRRVDVFVSTYYCERPESGFEAWAGSYNARGRNVILDARNVTDRETQRDTLLRGLRLVEASAFAYEAVVIARADLFFVSDFDALMLLASKRFLFHADMSDSARYVPPSSAPNATAVTDKLHFVPRAALGCFLDALDDDCFNYEEDDDGGWVNGEGCFRPVSKRYDEIGFLRDLQGETKPDTVGDNTDGDGVYRVLPRALGSMTGEKRASLFKHMPLGPYAAGECRGGLWQSPAHPAPPRRKSPRRPPAGRPDLR
ncbi:hypothetical protein M885DRAFT_517410 [Pelagophyceae sp. CCMP2097]|nr:hypothetical protein M885DRAFT_517410 [Pelagophyceae sp. CCMP2097]